MTRQLPRPAALILIVVVALTAAACGRDSGETTITATGTGGEFSFGSPARAADADRTIEIQTTDNLTFEPADITVTAGEHDHLPTDQPWKPGPRLHPWG